MTKKRRKPQMQKRSNFSTPPIAHLPAAKDVPPDEQARLQIEANRVELKDGYYPAWRLAQLCEMVSASRDKLLRDYLENRGLNA